MHCQAEVGGVRVRKTVTVRRQINAARSLFSVFTCMHAYLCKLMQISSHFNLNFLPRTIVLHGKRFSVSNP